MFNVPNTLKTSKNYVRNAVAAGLLAPIVLGGCGVKAEIPEPDCSPNIIEMGRATLTMKKIDEIASSGQAPEDAVDQLTSNKTLQPSMIRVAVDLKYPKSSPKTQKVVIAARRIGERITFIDNNKPMEISFWGTDFPHDEDVVFVALGRDPEKPCAERGAQA